MGTNLQKNTYGCFWIVLLKKTFESPLDSKEIRPINYKGDQHWILIEGLMLKLKFQYFGHLMQRADSLKETLMLGKIEGRRRRGWQRMTWLDEMVQWIWVWTNSGKYWSIGKPSMLQFKESQHQMWLNNWTITTTTTAPTHRETHTHIYTWVYMYTYIHVHISESP